MPTFTPPDTIALAALRPGDPSEKLAAAIGPRWRPPHPGEGGWVRYLERQFSFAARLDRDGRIGLLQFKGNFDPNAVIAGVGMRMERAAAEALEPSLSIAQNTVRGGDYAFGGRQLTKEIRLSVDVAYGKVSEINITNLAAVWPDWRELKIAPPRLAFNVKVVPGLKAPGSQVPQGWACGLPRGITPIQWPLSIDTGFPLEHHFTVRVPEPYRLKGPDYVALAVFSDTQTESRSTPAMVDFMHATLDGRPLPEEVGPELAPFLEHLRNRHPMETRTYDLLYNTFAFIWLTQDEIDGPECLPPAPIETDANEKSDLPDYLKTSAAERLFGWNGKEAFNSEYYLHRLAGRRPESRWDLLELRVTQVSNDPNAGKTPIEFDGRDNADRYVPRFDEAWEKLGLQLAYDDLQFGGTLMHGGGIYVSSPFFLAFHETMGQPNLAGQLAQLDLLTGIVDY
ncbi:hypothetical protein GCM10007301_37660 [Azorhizobium oxalatiphilum]|uniref:DUF7256 domain-containing protein n=1 Tax=Azorhizobium oxalatiphilum TaxID=980631 RepID=A0A917C6E7_9HYPH|nr:hypothetical protein [Azorhizobium oxalatiphilum]GGF74315.1 hypothetical protein GCM10007301_37660 [Azorhizobium oxalatiphilum]